MAKQARVVYDVLPDGRRWKLSEQGNGVRSLHSTKDQAINTAMRVARRNAPSQLRIHKLDGTVESERRYEEEPFPPPLGARQPRVE